MEKIIIQVILDFGKRSIVLPQDEELARRIAKAIREES
jgi:hypothetical protein